MNLVIDIPEERFKSLKAFNRVYPHVLAPNEIAIAEGRRLDIENSETRAYFDGEAFGWDEGRKALIDDIRAKIDQLPLVLLAGYYHIGKDSVLQILDCIGEGVRE